MKCQRTKDKRKIIICSSNRKEKKKSGYVKESGTRTSLLFSSNSGCEKMLGKCLQWSREWDSVEDTEVSAGKARREKSACRTLTNKYRVP